MELTQGSETSANYNLMPGKYPKEYVQLFTSLALTDRYDVFSVRYRLNLYVQFRLILGFKWLGGDIW